jgi:hypothetical protein
MTKNFIFILIIFVSSCSTNQPPVSLDLGYITIFREALFNQNTKIDPSSESNIKYSYIKISQGRNQAIFILRSSNNGLNTWIGPNLEKIITYQGLILKTSGLDQDFEFTPDSIEAITLNHLKSDFLVTGSLTNPLLPRSKIRFNYIKSSTSKKCKKLILYKRSIISLNSKFKESYCINEGGNIVSSTQRLSPLGDELKIDFNYRYK